jgi:hypothetical protein
VDPISAGLSIVGLGIQAFGGFSAAGNAHKAAAINQGIAQDEQEINEQKRQQMELQARRMQTEQFRNIQRLRSQATASAVSQGANTGSGLQGGLGQISDEGLTNTLGIRQNLQIGENIFAQNSDISNKKIQLAGVQSDMATDQAWSSLGGALVKDAGMIGGLSKDISAGFGNPFSLFNPGTLSGGRGTT